MSIFCLSDRSECFTLDAVHVDTNSTFLGIIQPHCNNCLKTIHSHISAIVYTVGDSFIQLSGLRHRGENENAKALRNSGGVSNQGSFNWVSGVIALQHSKNVCKQSVSTSSDTITSSLGVATWRGTDLLAKYGPQLKTGNGTAKM